MKSRSLLAAQILALAGLYYYCGKFGLSLAFLNESASAIWPPTGLSLAVLLLLGNRLWPGIFLGAFLVNSTTHVGIATTLGIAAGNTLEAVLGAWLVRRFANGLKAFEEARNLIRFILAAAILSTSLSATIGVTSLCIGGSAHWDQYGAIWLTWYLGDMVSNLVVAPSLIIWLGKPVVAASHAGTTKREQTDPSPLRKGKGSPGRPEANQILEAVVLLIFVILIGAIVFLGQFPFGGNNQPLAYLAILPLMWGAFRFGARGAAVSAFVMSGLALCGTLQGLGPFARPDPNQSLLFLQAFMGTITVTGLALASIISERQRVERRLRVHDAISSILADTPTLKEAAPRVFQALYEMGRWEAGAIWNVQRSSNEMYCVEFWHAPSAEVAVFETVTKQIRFAPGIGLPGRVWATGKPAWIADVTKDANFPRSSAAAAVGFHGAFCFPLKVGDQIIGVIECFSREVREPDEHFLQIWGPIGSQLGQYIERRRIEEAGQRSEALRGAILESALDCIISIDRHGNIIEFNPTSEKTFGYKRSDTLGKSLADLIIPMRFRERHRRGMEHYLVTGEGPVIGKRIEIVGLRADGSEFPVELWINALQFGGELVFTANLRDITERQKAVAELNEAQEKLRHHAEELEKRVEERTVNLREIIQSLDGFCYSIAHDLRAPLRALGGFSTELFNDYRAVLDDKGREYVVRIKDAAARMDQLISDLLKFGRLNTAELPTESLELGDTIRNALVSLEPDIKTKHATVVVKKPLLPVRGNAVMVEQAVVNLIGNALKFVPPGTAPHVEIWTEQRERRVRICVRDNGIGINEQYGNKLFQPFVRLVDGKDYPGTGIGLAIVRKGVERMGGEAGFESQPGKGSCFWVELPGEAGVRLKAEG
ncbi:MAG: hypothetical protein QOJ40_294 [Verrucomicrobiota bacterium]